MSNTLNTSKDGKARGKKTVFLIDSAIDKIILAIVLFMLAISAYAIWDSTNVYNQADAANYQAYKPDHSDQLPSYEDLVKMNPDVFGWLDVYGTKIDYPLVQGPDDQKYLSLDPTGKYSYGGAIFLDSKAQKDFSDFASFVYGHHMENDVMFGSLDHFTDKDFFDSHEYGDIYYGGTHHGLVFFAVVQVPDAFESPLYVSPIKANQAENYMSLINDSAEYVRDGVDVSPDDHIVMLSTCHSTESNGRMALVAKITDQTYANPFDTQNNGTGLQNPMDGIWAFLTGHKWVAPAALCGLIALYEYMTKHQQAENMSAEHTRPLHSV